MPQTIGNVTLTEVVIDAMWSVAPYKGKEKAVATALGTGFPKPNRTTSGAAIRALWGGPGMAFVICDALPDLTALAAVTDQSDAWAVVAVSGADSVDVLARLVPIDLRGKAFKTGHTARTMLGHMMVSVTRTGPDVFEIMAMRSMAGTLTHELTRAATLYTGRG
ncbi:sarcosine oxidase subunit gamma [Yoonia sp. R2331]|uniref:sarcosine oxidase subunit gamma n=1 Tax=Yoonia sp. R2331 TaxID=3237238 RepID=UPI0034E4416F